MLSGDPSEIEEFLVGREGQCLNEGLSLPQAKCILAARSFKDLLQLLTCDALIDKRPNWLLDWLPEFIAPHRDEPE
jgi:hypothetical protein